MAAKKSFIGQILLGRKLISQEQLDTALEIQKKEGGLLGEILVGRGFVSEEELSVALAAQMDLCYMPLNKYSISPALIKLIPQDIASKYCCVPLEIVADTLTVVMANPFNIEAIKAIEEVSRCKVVTFIGAKTQIKNAIETNYKYA